MEKLKRCPFCGGKAKITHLENYMWSAECDSCRVSIADSTSCFTSEENAIKAWNTRQSQGGEALKEVFELYEKHYEECVDTHEALNDWAAKWNILKATPNKEAGTECLCESCKKHSGCVIHKRYGDEIVKCDSVTPQ